MQLACVAILAQFAKANRLIAHTKKVRKRGPINSEAIRQAIVYSYDVYKKIAL